MGTIVSDGSFDSVFPVDILPPLFEVVLRAWPNVGVWRPMALEDKISWKLAAKMRLETRQSRLPVLIVPQYSLFDYEGEVSGRIDIVVVAGQREEVYFSFEGKRLNVDFPSGFRSEAGAYCDDGMMRYINEQYAPGLGRGGMLGYVMDGRCDAAIDAVGGAAANRRKALRFQREPCLIASSLLPCHAGARDSHHRTVSDRTFTIHHLFLAVRSA